MCVETEFQLVRCGPGLVPLIPNTTRSSAHRLRPSELLGSRRLGKLAGRWTVTKQAVTMTGGAVPGSFGAFKTTETTRDKEKS